MISAEIWEPLFLSLKLGLWSTSLLVGFCIPAAWVLVQSPRWFALPMEIFLTLPIVLPPSVLGFYLLVLMGAQGFLGEFSFWASGQVLAFSFPGLVLGSVIYSLPFVLQPILNSYQSIDSRALIAAASLGAGPWDRFFSIVLPLSRHGIFSGSILGFAHTLGEFGVVLMIGGNIPGETRVMSLAIFEYVETFQYGKAHLLSIILVFFSFLVLLVVAFLNKRSALLRSQL